MCWLHPVIINMQLVLSESAIMGKRFVLVEVRTHPFLFMALYPTLISIHARFSTFTGNRLSFREEDKLVLFLFCVFKESTVCRQTWSPLSNLGISLSTGGRVLDTSDTQVYMFVFCFWKGKNTGRTVITIKEELCPQILGVFLHCSHI